VRVLGRRDVLCDCDTGNEDSAANSSIDSSGSAGKYKLDEVLLRLSGLDDAEGTAGAVLKMPATISGAGARFTSERLGMGFTGGLRNP